MTERNLELTPRGENTRDKFRTPVIRFELEQIMQHFTDSISEIRNQFEVADELINAGKNKDAENIWRSQVIFLASALDFYMHELTKYGLCEIFADNWEHTEKYENIEVNMKVIETALKAGEEVDWFLDYVNGYYRKITMVSYESVKEQLNLLGISIENVANAAFYQQGSSEKTKDKLKRRLNELFNRRNIIAHQSDRSHEDAQTKVITKNIVEDFIRDIEKVVIAISDESKNK